MKCLEKISVFLRMKFPHVFKRKYLYKQISCYYSKKEVLLLIPSGELLPFGGEIEIEPIFEIKAPFKKAELEQKIEECFALCWSKTVDGFPKGQSVIEKYVNVKGHRKIVKMFELFYLIYEKDTKEYVLNKTFKSIAEGCYSGTEEIRFGEKIDYDCILHLIQE